MEVMVTRCFFSFFLAGVIIASTIFPASAWSKDSFISGGEEYESPADVALSDELSVPDIYAAPRRVPRMFKVSAADQASIEANTNGKLVVPATLPTSVDGTFQVMSKYYLYQPAQSTPPMPKFEADYWRDVVVTFSSSPSFISDYIHLVLDHFDYSPDVSDPNEMVRGLAVFCNKDKAIFPKGNYVTGATADVGSDSWAFTLNYDVSSYASSAFSLDGVDKYILGFVGPAAPNWISANQLSVEVLVDGASVGTFYTNSSHLVDFGGYVYSGSSNVSTISFRWHMPFCFFISDDPAYAGSYTCVLRSDILRTFSNALTISFLDGQDIINAQNNKTKDDINKHEELESQWVGSMTENFNSLGFDSFSWSDSLVSGFSLFSGIFMDIWRALGGATILFTFPLLLGVALLLIGRISRSGGRSGSGKGGGDGG